MNPLTRFIKRRQTKTEYVMVRLDKRPDLKEFVDKRAHELGTSKQGYLLALIDADRASVRKK